MNSPIRSAVTLLVISLALLAPLAVFIPTASAQTTVVGSADFRNAPQLPPGQYVDRIVTGDTAWYAVIYTNSTPYRFEVSFQGNAPAGVDLSASFVAPTLTTVDGPAQVVEGNGVEYPAGHTNVWFLKVSLNTSSQIGVEYPIVINVEGVQTLGVEPCADDPDCELDDEYAAINVALAEAEAELEQLRAAETTDAVQAEIENIRGFQESADSLGPRAQARLAQLEAQLAEKCAPEPDCEEFPDPGSKTPIIGWIIGFAAIALGVRKAVKKLRQDPNAEPTPPPRQPASLSAARAQKDAQAKNKKKKKATSR